MKTNYILSSYADNVTFPRICLRFLGTGVGVVHTVLHIVGAQWMLINLIQFQCLLNPNEAFIATPSQHRSQQLTKTRLIQN